MKFFRKRSISRDLQLGLSFAVIIVAIMTTGIYYGYSTWQLDAEMSAKQHQTMEEVTNVVILPLWDLNAEMLKQISRGFITAEYLARIQIGYNGYNYVDIGKDRDRTANHVMMEKKLFKDGIHIGTVRLTFTDAEIRKAQKTMVYAIVMVLASIIVTLIVGIRLVMKALLDDPLDQLIQGIRAIASGNYDQPMANVAQDEINAIICEVNTMAMEISLRERKLEQLNRDLQSQIEMYRQTQQALEESETNYRSIFENAMEGIYQSDLQGQFLTANPAMARMLGYDSARQLMDSITDIGTQLYVHPKQRVELMQLLESDATVSDFQCELYRKDKSIIWVSIQARAIFGTDGKMELMEGLMVDITDKKKAEEELSAYRKHLELLVRERTEELVEANIALRESMETLKKTQDHLVESRKMAALGNLVAGVAHEINTPLGIGITGASFLIRKTDEVLSLFGSGKLKRSDFENYLEIAKESSESILTNLERSAELIQTFKMVAVDQNKAIKRQFNLCQQFEVLLASFGPELKKTGHRVRIDCPEDLTIVSFPGPIMQVFTNMMMNSLIHGFEDMENGLISIEINPIDDDVEIRYEDNGKGMEIDDVKKIFDPFFTTKLGKGGSGLGMHIVYNLVTKNLGGTIQGYCEPGKGLGFFIRIPKQLES